MDVTKYCLKEVNQTLIPLYGLKLFIIRVNNLVWPLLWPLIITHIVLLFVTTGDEFNAYVMCSVSEGADDIKVLQGITENTLQ